jgi:predicted dehydrogenase
MPTNHDDLLKRRDLLGRGSALALGLLMGGASALHAEELLPEATLLDDTPAVPATPVTVAVIGLGEQGREILTALNYVPGATVAYVCDSYANAHKRALEIQPKAKAVEDYKQVLSDKAVQAVYVVTPSHQHKQIVLDALAAGKHVYCEAPLASSIEDAKAIAQAAIANPKLIFHTGLQLRTDPQHNHVLAFVRQGVLARIAQSKSTWHKKTSWKRTAPTDERQNALNWRLSKATSGGLMGEIGIHQVDAAAWFMKATPTSVTGFGGITFWNDGRTVQDTVQCVFEYPNNSHLTYDATLANSFDGAYELFQGSDAAVLLRDSRAWLFKEVDAPEMGWEVYAFKEKVGDDTGIALVADATKLLAQGLEPGKNRATDPTKGSLYWASNHFLNAIRTNKPSDVGAQVGYEATVVALKANEAALTGTKITFTKEMFTL